MKELIIHDNEAGQRLDKLLRKYLNEAPGSFIYKMLRKKNIVLNGKKATGNEHLREGDRCISGRECDSISFGIRTADKGESSDFPPVHLQPS